MKKSVLILAAVALVFTLSACGTQQSVVSVAASGAATARAGPSPALAAFPVVETTVRQATFCVTHTDYVKAIDPWLAARSLQLLSAQDNQFEVANEIGYGNTPGTGLTIDQFTAPKGDELTQIVLRLDLDAADDAVKSAFVDIANATIYGLDPDQYDTIKQSLNPGDATDNIETTAEGNKASYVYTVKANIEQLFIVAK